MRAILLVLILFISTRFYAQPDVPIDFQSATQLLDIDLDKLPQTRAKVWINFVPVALNWLNRESLKYRISKSFEKLIYKINDDMLNNMGVLVRVDYITVINTGVSYVDKNSVQPLKGGLTPEDALSDYFNEPKIEPKLNSSSYVKNNRMYQWIYKNSNGKIQIGRVPYPEIFERKAKIITAKKIESQKLLYFDPMDYEMKVNDVATYWNDNLINYKNLLEQKALYESVKSSTDKFQNLQNEFNVKYNKIKELERKQVSESFFLKHFGLITYLQDFMQQETEIPFEKNSQLLQMEKSLKEHDTELQELKVQLRNLENLIKSGYRKATTIQFESKPSIGVM